METWAAIYFWMLRLWWACLSNIRTAEKSRIRIWMKDAITNYQLFWLDSWGHKKFIEQKLFLKVNEDKTKICHLSQDVKFLGYTFYKRRNKDSGGEEWKTAVYKKSRKKFKNTVREILDRRCPLGLEKCKSKLRKFITGWANYFKYGLTKNERLKFEQ